MAWSWGGAGQGMMSGAATGTQVMPGWGTVIGGVAGGVIGGLTAEEEKEREDELKIISTLNPEQQQLFSQLSGFYGGNIGRGLRAWEGDWTTPISGGEEWGIGKYKEAVEGMDPGQVEDWYMKYIAPQEERYMREKILPGIREAGVPGGTLRGTGTEGRVSGAWERFGESQLGRIGETIMGERAAGRAALPGYMGAAALPRLIEQQDLDRQIAEFVRTTPELNPIIDQAMKLLGMQTQAAYFPGQKESGWATMMPAIGQMAGSVDWGSVFGGGGGVSGSGGGSGGYGGTSPTISGTRTAMA